MNNLQALEALKQSAAKQQQELESTINETHKQSLNQLESDLKAIHTKRLKAMQGSMLKELQKPQKNPWKLITIIGVLSSLLGALMGAWSMKEIKESKYHQVPKAWSYGKTDQGYPYFIAPSKEK